MNPICRALLCASPLALGLTPPVISQQLVKDFTPPTVSEPSSDPGPAVVLGGIAYFAATDLLGNELWRTDGSAAGTYRVKDLNPGSLSSNPSDLVVAGSRLFFSADVPGYGRELFASDGTAAGTGLVRDLHAVADQSSEPRNLVAFQGRVWFTADDGVLGRELWSSDGTVAGTTPVDIAPGASPSSPTSLAVWNGRLWFSAQDSRGRELWSSDGTVAGTQLFADLFAGAPASDPQEITPAQGQLYFSAALNASGRELWASDGTVAGTRLVADVYPGATGSFPRTLVALGGVVVFQASDPVSGTEPWRSDGTLAGTFLLRDIRTGTPTSVPAEFTRSAANNLVFFIASDLAARTLWATDGTVAGTYQPSAALTSAGRLAAAFAGVAFSATTVTTGAALWVSNGTLNGTVRVAGSPDPSFISAFGATHILFRGGDNTTGRELYLSDATPQGTGLVRDVAPAWGSSSFSEFVDLRGSLFFSPTPVAGWVPWISNGAEAGTYELTQQIGSPRNRVLWNGDAWFVGSTTATGFELCKSDGTPAGTVVAIDVLPGVPTSGPTLLTPAVGHLFFTAQTPTSGRDLWATDGTSLGTVDLGIAAGTATSRPANLTTLGARCFLAATDASGEEPWVSDGTLAGTLRLADLAPGSASSGPASFVALGSRMFFSAQTPTTGRELFVSDGTPGGTLLFADLWPGTTGSQVSNLVACEPLLFFRATAPGAGTELWVTDGTVAGTRMLPEIVPGTGSPQIRDMVGTPGRLFCLVDDLQSGLELWTSDGTPAGTRRVIDLLPGLGHGVQAGTLIKITGTQFVAFSGSDGVDGLQLWRSDGTLGGTTRLGRMGSLPGSGASIARNFGVVGERLFFTGGVEGSSGEELWVVSLAGLGAAFAGTYGDANCAGTGSLEPRIGAFGLPRIGNAAFAIDVFDARPLAPAIVQLGIGQVDLPLGPCRLLVAPLLLALPPILTNSQGAGRTPLPIPPDQALRGARLTGQYAIVDQNGALFGGLALSDGLLMQLGQ